MSHTTKIVKRGSLLVGALLAVLAGGAYFQAVIHLDPYAGLKKTSAEIDPKLGVRIEGVQIESFDHEKLVMKAQMRQLDVRQDKQHYELFGIHDGVYYGKKGEMRFDAPKGEWNVAAHQLDAPTGAHIVDKNVDLQVPQFTFKSDSGDVSVPGQVKGKMYDGQVLAQKVKYNVNSGKIVTGPIQWNGKVALTLQEGDPQAKPRSWHIEAPGGFEADGDIAKYDNAIGTDGDIIVAADHIEQNRKTDIVTATGHVRYFSSKTNMTCDKAVIERKTKVATLTGNVQMLLKRKEKQDTVSMGDGVPPYRPVVPDEIAKSRPQADQAGQTPEQKRLDDEIRSGKNVHDYDAICYADQIVYHYKKGERQAEITGHPQARQELEGGWRQVWTFKAHYDGEKDTLKMESSSADNPETRMINSIGDDLTAQWLQISTKDGDEKYHGYGLKGTLMDYSDEVPPGSKPKNPATLPGFGPTKGGGGLKGGIGGKKS